MAQKPGPNRSQELEEISKSIQLTMEILTSVKETPKTKAKGQEGRNPRSRNKGAKGYGRKFRCYRCNFTGHSAAQCRTDWEIIKTYQKSKQEDTDSD